MHVAKVFEPTRQDIVGLVAAYPFATVTSFAGSTPHATPLPLLYCESEDGDFLRGHFAKSNPHVMALRENPRAHIVFYGPHQYISPSWFRDRSQAPTWFFATAQFTVDIEFDDAVEAADHAVNALTEQMERGRPDQWRSPELADRYQRFLRAIVAFKAPVLTTLAKFKLGQNERDDVFEDVMEGADSVHAKDLRDMMRVHSGRKLESS